MSRATGIEFIAVPTPQLKAMMERHQATLPAEQYDRLLADLRGIYQKYCTVLAGYPAGPARARAVYRLITPPIQQSAIEPTCAKGCGACCHLEVEVTQDEGELLARLVLDGLSIDPARLAVQAARPRRSADWGFPIREDNRCVFLGDDDACRIYEARPSICRKHAVASQPSACMEPGGQPLPILIPLAELVLSAALSQPGNTSGALSKKLSEALAEAESSLSAQKNSVIPACGPERTDPAARLVASGLSVS